MAKVAYTFPVGWPTYCLGEVDGHAEIGSSGIEEIFAHDYLTQDSVTVAGRLEEEIRQYLHVEMGHLILEAEDEARRGAIQYAREIRAA